MAKSQHSFMKRQREIDKKKKAAAKREKREDKKNMPSGGGPEIVSFVENHGVVVGSMGSAASTSEVSGQDDKSQA